MTSQPQAAPPQPDDRFVIQSLQEELTRVNNNRLWLMSALAQTKWEAETEIGRLHSITFNAVAQIEDDKNRDKVMAYLGEQGPPFGPPPEGEQTQPQA